MKQLNLAESKAVAGAGDVDYDWIYQDTPGMGEPWVENDYGDSWGTDWGGSWLFNY